MWTYLAFYSHDGDTEGLGHSDFKRTLYYRGESWRQEYALHHAMKRTGRIEGHLKGQLHAAANLSPGKNVRFILN
jgi:hypothetical protein